MPGARPEPEYAAAGVTTASPEMATGLTQGGQSGIGSTAIQMAKAWGARVFCTVGSAEKAAAARDAGADAAIN